MLGILIHEQRPEVLQRRSISSDFVNSGATKVLIEAFAEELRLEVGHFQLLKLLAELLAKPD